MDNFLKASKIKVEKLSEARWEELILEYGENNQINTKTVYKGYKIGKKFTSIKMNIKSDEDELYKKFRKYKQNIIKNNSKR